MGKEISKRHTIHVVINVVSVTAHTKLLILLIITFKERIES